MGKHDKKKDDPTELQKFGLSLLSGIISGIISGLVIELITK